jgi:hypothetical protein
MPIAITCSSCSKSLKVADTLAGRAIKCTGCTAIVKVPGGSSAANPATPRATNGTAAPSASGARPAAPGGSDAVKRPAPVAARSTPAPANLPEEELDEVGRDNKVPSVKLENSEVPEKMRERVANELSRGEKLIWVGIPSRRIVMIRSLWGPIAGVFFLFIFGVIGLFFAFTASKTGGIAGAIVPLLGIGCMALLFVGSSMLAPVWAFFKQQRTCYALTNRRCIVWSCGWFGTVTMTSYNPMQLTNMWRRDMWIFGKGGGDVVFRTRTVTTITTGRHGGVSQRTYLYGFLSIENVGEVERLIRETLLDRMMDRIVG